MSDRCGAASDFAKSLSGFWTLRHCQEISCASPDSETTRYACFLLTSQASVGNHNIMEGGNHLEGEVYPSHAHKE